MAGGLGVASGGGSGEINALLHSGAWYKNTRIIKLNLWILLLLITSSTNGYDGVSKNPLSLWRGIFLRSDPPLGIGPGSLSLTRLFPARLHDERSPDPQAMEGGVQQPFRRHGQLFLSGFTI